MLPLLSRPRLAYRPRLTAFQTSGERAVAFFRDLAVCGKSLRSLLPLLLSPPGQAEKIEEGSQPFSSAQDKLLFRCGTDQCANNLAVCLFPRPVMLQSAWHLSADRRNLFDRRDFGSRLSDQDISPIFWSGRMQHPRRAHQGLPDQESVRRQPAQTPASVRPAAIRHGCYRSPGAPHR
jgi:hypothetical protein